MKYLASFIMSLILFSMIQSSQFNASEFKKFLSNLKPGTSDTKISKELEQINSTGSFKEVNLQSEEFKRFRFASKLASSESELASLLAKAPAIKSGWLSVKSDYFVDNKELPDIMLPSGEPDRLFLDNGGQVINTAFVDSEELRNQNVTKKHFFARINKDTLYLSPNQTSSQIVFFLTIKSVKKIKNLNSIDHCFEVKTENMKSKKDPLFTLCSNDTTDVVQWVCLIEKINKGKNYKKCLDKQELVIPPPAKKVVQRTLRQPLIIIPTPQRMCNQGWNYHKKAEDWECICAEGKQQSPIDLPPIKKAVSSPVKPMFTYDIVNESDNKLKIRHNNNTLNVSADTAELLKERGFGKLVTMDGTVYYATDIIFHTPAEHTIDGKKFPLEIQVIHEAKTKGDFGKKAVFSVLFEGKPGVYNRFIDDLEFFNLPNPSDKYRMLHNKLFVPNLLLSTEDNFTSVINPFSFYTYQGSMSAPPCVENVIWFVTASPIPASITSIDMFKEAMRMPDFEDTAGNIVISPESPLENNRPTQPLNGRTVFVYDKDKYAAPSFSSEMNEQVQNRDGHYEKQEQMVTNYVFVEGQEPTNIPGAMVVPESEAK